MLGSPSSTVRDGPSPERRIKILVGSVPYQVHFHNHRGDVHPIGGEMDHPLRLMTWNVRSLRDDRDAVVGVLRRAAPDVLFVQEAPRFFRARSKLAALARESDLVVVCGGQPAAGVAILSNLRMSR